MGARKDNQPASRVVEEPRRSPLPYFAVAIVAAIGLWSILQPSITGPGNASRKTAAQGRERSNDSRDAHPALGDLRTLFSADDYPAVAVQNGDQGTVQARLAVDTHGRVSNCSITRSSGHASLDIATCNILQRRARFTPARDVNGNPVPDSVTTPPVVWRLEG